jgi:hypothetical protein
VEHAHQAAEHRQEHEGRCGVQLDVVLSRLPGELLPIILDG